MRYALVREGRALILIPDPERARAPHGFEPAWLPVFYNPRMIFNRDLSVAALRAYADLLAPHKPVHGVDALSGTGVRAVRYALESGDDLVLHANDIDPSACETITANIRLNGVEDRVRAHCGDAIGLLEALRREEPLLFVDIDPFGSPAPFAPSALRATGHRGMAAFTATDLAVLEGSKPRAARRKYWVEPAKTPESKEIGLRVLLGFLARQAASLDKSVRPLAAYYADHYYRVYLLVERGARRADRMLEEDLGFATYCPKSRATLLDAQECPLGEKPVRIGPVWIGPLWDQAFLEEVLGLLRGELSYLETLERAMRLVSVLLEEAGACQRCLHYRLDALASVHTPRLPKITVILERLRGMGYAAVRSHFHPMAVRTNAPYEAVAEALRTA